MQTDQFDAKTVTICLEQKVTLFTNMLNISKQIEVQTRQSQIILDDLLAKRQTMMDRIDKCNDLIDRQLSYLSEAEQLHWHTILHDNHYTAVDENEKSACALVNKSYELCLRIAEINTAAAANINSERADLKKRLKGTKKTTYRKV